MELFFKRYSAEILFGLLVTVLAVILDYYWWVRLPLAVLSVGIIWHLFSRTNLSGGWRFVGAALATIFVVLGSWHAIWAGLKADWPQLAQVFGAFGGIATATVNNSIVRVLALIVAGIVAGHYWRDIRQWWKAEQSHKKTEQIYSMIAACIAVLGVLLVGYSFYTMWDQTHKEGIQRADIAYVLGANGTSFDSLQDAAHHEAAYRTEILHALTQLCAHQVTPLPAECRLAPKLPKPPAKK
jgi:hypothetical protein